jgi:GNAT superfamily N-acetyltransferase
VLGFYRPGFFVTKVFDGNALQTGVTKILTEDYGLANVSGVNCGQNIKVTQGASFTCSANVDGKPVTVPVRVTSSAGDYEVGQAHLSHEPRKLDSGELRGARDLFIGALLHPLLDDEGWARSASAYDPDRTWGVHAGDALVGTATSFPSRMAVPGGAVLDTAAVTQVGVRADHTRRGLLTALMRAQLDDVAARGEALAALHATEARIYGRFGYGVATRRRPVRVRRSGRGPASHGARRRRGAAGHTGRGRSALRRAARADRARPTGDDHARGDLVALTRRARPP